jgi:hypothetical protein
VIRLKSLFMKKICFGLLAVLLMSFSATETYAQFNRAQIKRNNKRIATYRGRKHFGREKVYSGVGFSLNALNYFGDLSPLPSKLSTDISFTKPGFGLSFFHRFGPRYTLIGQFMFGTLKGADAESAKSSDASNGVFRYQRNLSFRNQIKELTVVAVFDLFENNGTYISRVKWTPYAFAGVSLFLQNPQGIAPPKYLDGSTDPYAGQWVDLQPLGTEGQYSNLQQGDVNYGIKPYSLLQFAIPFGVGARFRLNEVLDLWADIGFRYTFTDYLDDVSKNYVDLGAIQAKDPSMTKLAQAMAYRSGELNLPNGSYVTYTGRDGNNYTVLAGYGQEFKDNWRGRSNANDIFMVTSIKVTYILGATFHRAKFR